MFLVKALVEIPLMVMDQWTVLQLIAGVSPLLFLRGDGVRRYFGGSVFAAAGVGVVRLLGNPMHCLQNDSICVHYNMRSVLIAGGAYAALTVVGFLIVRPLPKKPRQTSLYDWLTHFTR